MPSEYRPVRIADVGAALRLLSEVYPDARRALAEFIANAADAFILGERQGIRRNWRCEVHLTDKKITVTDNGPGITRERLLELPSQVTLSAKAGDLQQKGHKAIGLLAYSSFCAEMHIFSRAEGEDDTFEAHWTSASLRNPEQHPVRVDSAAPNDSLRAAGTSAVFSGIFEDRLHQLRAQKLADFLRAEFSPDLAGWRRERLPLYQKSRAECANRD